MIPTYLIDERKDESVIAEIKRRSGPASEYCYQSNFSVACMHAHDEIDRSAKIKYCPSSFSKRAHDVAERELTWALVYEIYTGVEFDGTAGVLPREGGRQGAWR